MVSSSSCWIVCKFIMFVVAVVAVAVAVVVVVVVVVAESAMLLRTRFGRSIVQDDDSDNDDHNMKRIRNVVLRVQRKDIIKERRGGRVD
jgi:hypothetical protein